MDEFDLINRYLVPISSIESQFLKNDGAVFKPKINLDYVVSTDTIVENIHFQGNEAPELIASSMHLYKNSSSDLPPSSQLHSILSQRFLAWDTVF